MTVAEHDFGVGAHINQQHHIVGQVRTLSQNDPSGIRTDMPGKAR